MTLVSKQFVLKFIPLAVCFAVIGCSQARAKEVHGYPNIAISYDVFSNGVQHREIDLENIPHELPDRAIFRSYIENLKCDAVSEIRFQSGKYFNETLNSTVKSVNLTYFCKTNTRLPIDMDLSIYFEFFKRFNPRMMVVDFSNGENEADIDCDIHQGHVKANKEESRKFGYCRFRLEINRESKFPSKIVIRQIKKKSSWWHWFWN